VLGRYGVAVARGAGVEAASGVYAA
jgi:hypothetical protein